MTDPHPMAMLLLAVPTPIDPAALENALRAAHPQQSGALAMTGGPGGTPVQLTIAGVPLVLLPVAAPIPADELADPVERMRGRWPESAGIAAGHKAHVIVAPAGRAEGLAGMVAEARAVTAVIGALAAQLPVTACYAPTATAIVRPDLLTRLSALAFDVRVPLPLWVDLQLFRGNDTADGQPQVGGLTVGLATFAGRELHFAARPVTPDYVAGRLDAIAQYLLVTCAELKDGDSIGLSETEKIRVHHETAPSGARYLSLTVEHTEP